jgi:hypothetical protein
MEATFLGRVSSKDNIVGKNETSTTPLIVMRDRVNDHAAAVRGSYLWPCH